MTVTDTGTFATSTDAESTAESGPSTPDGQFGTAIGRVRPKSGMPGMRAIARQ